MVAANPSANHLKAPPLKLVHPLMSSGLVLSSMMSVFTPVMSWKAWLSMLSRLAGSVRLGTRLQLLKAKSSMYFTPEPRSSLVISVSPSKALLAMVFTLLGMVMAASLPQSRKAFLPILVTPSCMVTVVSLR